MPKENADSRPAPVDAGPAPIAPGTPSTVVDATFDVPLADAGANPDRCKCGALRNAKDANRCAKGHAWTRNQLPTVVGQHAKDFWRTEAAKVAAIRDAFLAEQGYAGRPAPLGLQIVADSLAQSVIVRDEAYRAMRDSGGPLQPSGKPRRAYSVWQQTNEQLIRDLRNAVSELAAIQPAARSGDEYALDHLTDGQLYDLAIGIAAEIDLLRTSRPAPAAAHPFAHLGRYGADEPAAGPGGPAAPSTRPSTPAAAPDASTAPGGPAPAPSSEPAPPHWKYCRCGDCLARQISDRERDDVRADLGTAHLGPGDADYIDDGEATRLAVQRRRTLDNIARRYS